MGETQSVAEGVTRFATDVQEGLTREDQKEIPSKYLYDELGSHLFEAITALPEYGPTNADERLLRRNAGRIADWLPTPVVVAELGSGSARKTRWLLEELARREPATFCPIDISGTAIQLCLREVESIEGLTVHGIEERYLPGLREAAAKRTDGAHLVVLFLGSTIGNFRPAEGENFLRHVRMELEPGDSLFLSTDLVKPVPQLLPAYDDPAGVTAAFNLNLLARINRELGADFDLSQFEHLALYNHHKKRIEMHLLSLAEQTVTVAATDLTVQFDKHETIWTESCHKFTPEDVVELGRQTGYRCEAQWIDEEWPFAQSLLVAR